MRNRNYLTPSRKPMRVAVFQVSGISLMTVSGLNSLFLKHIDWHANFLLAASGLGLLWLSYHVWCRHQVRGRGTQNTRTLRFSSPTRPLKQRVSY